MQLSKALKTTLPTSKAQYQTRAKLNVPHNSLFYALASSSAFAENTKRSFTPKKGIAKKLVSADEGSRSPKFKGLLTLGAIGLLSSAAVCFENYESNFFEKHGLDGSEENHVPKKLSLLPPLSNFSLRKKIYEISRKILEHLPASLFIEHSEYGSLKELISKFKFKEVLGEGSFAAVYRAVHQITGEVVAVKKITKELSDNEVLENEVRVLRACGTHPNIISLKDVYEDEDYMYLVMELAQGGELFDRIIAEGEFSERDASRIMRQATRAIRHIHKKNCIHLDVKPENLLLAKEDGFQEDDENLVKLADFGLAIKLPDDEYVHKKEEQVGTPVYWAPELIGNDSFGKPVDIWALGCVLYILICGSHPFDEYGDLEEVKILARIVRGDYDRSNEQYLAMSPQGKDLLTHMLDPDPATRYNAKQVLAHPWMSDAEQLLTAESSAPRMAKLRAFRLLQLLREAMPRFIPEFRYQSISTTNRKFFDMLDADNDGFVSKGEMANLFKKLGISLSTSELKDLMLIFDKNSDGKVSFEEFQEVTVQHIKTIEKSKSERSKGSPRLGRVDSNQTLEDLKALFNFFDRQRTGYIEKSDCLHVLKVLGSLDTDSTELFAKMKESEEKLRFPEEGELELSDKVDFADFVRYYRKGESQRKRRKGTTLHTRRGSVKL
eukprot:snap_masked-scaffold_3-processed-gene-5.19-mRNA-1 protein AED:0.17 eAED:0.21 QI:0/-1/0/1/-1/1/1/0/664